MFLVDDLLTAPGRAVFFLLKELAQKAQEEWLDDDTVKQELQEIYALLEAGKISEQEFEDREVRLVERLQQIAMAKLEERSTTVSQPPPSVEREQTPAYAPEQIKNAIFGAETKFAGLASTLRPLLEMVGAQQGRDEQQVTSGLRVEPLEDLAAAAPAFGLPPAEPSRPVAPPPMTAPVLPSTSTSLPRPPAGALTINQVVDSALGGLSLLRLRVSAVTAVARAEDGWRVTAELVERRGVPDTSDLLGVYELRLDESGNVLQWQRTRLRRRCDLGAAAP